eukprot:15631-Heterococcus_DN1.PRE.6
MLSLRRMLYDLAALNQWHLHLAVTTGMQSYTQLCELLRNQDAQHEVSPVAAGLLLHCADSDCTCCFSNRAVAVTAVPVRAISKRHYFYKLRPADTHKYTHKVHSLYTIGACTDGKSLKK